MSAPAGPLPHGVGYHAAPAPYHPAPAPYHAAPHHGGGAPHHGNNYKDEPAHYQYGYAVHDDYSGVNFGANEARDGYATNGEYHVALPDGRIQTVTYQVADDYSGYVADVKYSGEPHYDAHKPAPYHAGPVHKPAPYHPGPVHAPAPYHPGPSHKAAAPYHARPNHKSSSPYHAAPVYKPAPTYGGPIHALQVEICDNMGIDNIDIICQRDPPVFRGGDIILGNVVVSISGSPVKVRCISIKFKGKAKVYFTITTGAGSSRNSTTYRNQEEYYKQSTNLVGDGTNIIDLDPGTHTYPFSYTLERDLPFSFESNYRNKVVHSIQVNVDLSSSFDKKEKKYFTVLHDLDLNQEPHLASSANKQESKKLTLPFSRNKTITGSVTIPRTGFVPGDQIQAQIQIENRSSVKVSKSSVTLLQIVELIGRHGYRLKSKTINTTLATTEGRSVASEDVVGWTTDPMTIPTVPPSGIPKCDFIKIHYFVRPFIPPLDQDYGNPPFKKNINDVNEYNKSNSDNKLPIKIFHPKTFTLLASLASVALSAPAGPLPHGVGYHAAPAPYHPAPAPYHAAPHHGGGAPHHGNNYKDEPAHYQYGYAVHDDYSGVNFGANEARDGYATNGEYHVALPDGRIQTVTYQVADDYSGYVADVKYSGEPHYDAHKPAPYHAGPVHKPAPYHPGPVHAPAPYHPGPSHKAAAPYHARPNHKSSSPYHAAPVYKPAPTYGGPIHG
ncbi:hypothetical protein TCAL_10036 [Tigriopus californicus]|uniref:Arrestin C-terminal-like domain-containing protein n=1 Tax=Tigriopus californicus TaxID=6832 RepID=A0A553PNF0_TIGCA|nr:hypothetical protein TCAL_10036 [Tigriopus californicus]